MDQRSILVLGAYGLAGRAIVHGLLNETPYRVVAAGRNPDALRDLVAGLEPARIERCVLDVSDRDALRKASEDAALVVNAVGPFARLGADTARVAIECGRSYVDCANEQIHYRRLQPLDALAQKRGALLATAAGAIPGCSTMLMARSLEVFPEATSVDAYWAQFRHAYADSGLASVMGGILEAMHLPVALHDGRNVPVTLGSSVRTFAFPEPFGVRRVFELPTIDALTIPARFKIRDLRTWFFMGDVPTGLLGIVRMLRPDRRAWAYRLVERIVRSVNARDTARAIAAGVGPESLIVVVARCGDDVRSASILFRDGAVATACLPVRIAREVLAGRCHRTGLATPLDLFRPADILAGLGDAALRVHLASAP